MGGAGQEITEQLNSETPCDHPQTGTHSPSSVRKSQLSASFVPQRAENHTSLSIQAWENGYRQMKYVWIILVV